MWGQLGPSAVVHASIRSLSLSPLWTETLLGNEAPSKIRRSNRVGNCFRIWTGLETEPMLKSNLRLDVWRWHGIWYVTSCVRIYFEFEYGAKIWILKKKEEEEKSKVKFRKLVFAMWVGVFGHWSWKVQLGLWIRPILNFSGGIDMEFCLRLLNEFYVKKCLVRYRTSVSEPQHVVPTLCIVLVRLLVVLHGINFTCYQQISYIWRVSRTFG